MTDYEDYQKRAEYLDGIAISNNFANWTIRKGFYEESDFGTCIHREYSSGNQVAEVRLWSSGAISLVAGNLDTADWHIEEVLAFGDEVGDFVEFVATLASFLRGAHSV